ncbi:MAG: GntR-family transcriptional regulator [candidate division TA06 bacterium 32_111]|jgi:DNA-binding GntR family transcriptional regulator|nr:MAG: GntR-family transcriptional regulator [candidate division TA06 bacterium 32_111]
MIEKFAVLQHPSSIKEIAYENIKTQIIQGNLTPGSWLREQELADAMEISRAPIREAFNQLEREGFIEILPRKGAKVISISEKEVEDIFEIRETLESLAIQKSLKNISLEKLNQITIKFERFKLKPAEKSIRLEYLSLDKEFHDLLIQHCNNKMLINLLASIQEKVHWLRGFSLDNYSFAQSIEEHIAIIDAIQRNNEKLVLSNLVRHLERAKESTISEIRAGKIG